MHRHDQDDETFIVLDGVLALLVAGERVDGAVGDIVHLPGGEVHAWRVESELARFLIIATPQHEAFYRDCCVPAPSAVCARPRDVYIRPETARQGNTQPLAPMAEV